jgi:hypothetical protein
LIYVVPRFVLWGQIELVGHLGFSLAVGKR